MAIAISIVGKYDGKDIAKAQRELNAMAKSAGIATKGATDVGNGFKSMAGKLAIGALAIGGVTAGFTSLINAAQQSAKVQATTVQIIKSTGGAARVTAGQVAELSRRLSEQTGIDDELIQSSTNLLLTFKNVKNVGDGVNAMLDRATLAAQDLAAAGFGSAESSAKMLGKALNDPVKGLTALSRAGVTFSEVQKDQVKELVKSNDLFGAQRLIMAEVESQVGGVATATATATGRLSVMMGNMQEDLGAALLPFLSALADGLGPALKELTPALTTMANTIGTLLTNAVKVLLPPLTAVVTFVVNLTAALLNNRVAVVITTAVLGLWTIGLIAARVAAIQTSIANTGLLATFPRLATAIATASTVLGGFRAALLLAAGPVGVIVGVLAAVAGAFYLVNRATEETAVRISQVNRVTGQITPGLNAARGSTRAAAEAMQVAGVEAYVFSNQLDAATSAAFRLQGALAGVSQSRKQAANDEARARVTKSVAAIELEALLNDLKAGGGGASDKLKAQVEKFRELGTGITERIAAGIQASEMTVTSALDKMIGSVIGKAKRTAADPAFGEVMASVAESIRKNISDALTTAADSLEKAKSEAATWASSMATTLAGGFDISGMFKDSIGEDGKLIVSKWTEGVDKAFAQFEYYTNVLTAIKAGNGSDALLQYLVSQGVENGAAEGQAMLDQGLIPYFNQKLEAIKTLSETTAQAMVPAFLQSGIDSAQQTYNGLKAAVGKGGPVFNAIQNLMDNLARSMNRSATVTVTTVNRVITELVNATKLPGRANGGPVSANTAYLVGERGPEVFMASASGQIVPNVDLGTSVSRAGVMTGGGGNTYNINVNAGVGDPRAIGQQIVEYVRKYENASGKVFAAA
jgi:hypothetical protein